MSHERGLYKKIKDCILDDYRDWLDGEALPSERDLADKYGVKRSTVQYALRKLEDQGKVYRIRGKGTFMRKERKGAEKAGSSALQGARGISALVRSYGIKVSSEVLVCGAIYGNRFLEKRLGLESGEPVFALHRVRYGNDEPLAIEYTYVPQDLFTGIGGMDFSMVSLYDFMEAHGHLPESFEQKTRLVKIPPKEARYLELEADTPVFYYEFTGMDTDRRVVEYTESYIRCDKTEFKFTAKL